MMDGKLHTYVLLLVEDNPADAELIEELLDHDDADLYRIVKVASVAAATEKLHAGSIDVILLDLRLPDGVGTDSVKSVRAAAGEIPIVVLTGMNDEQLALACIDAGAQDYLPKAELRAVTLRRAIGYAITRLREAQIRDLQQTLEQLRALSSASARTITTAVLAGTGAVRERYRDEYAQLIHIYGALLALYCEYLAAMVEKPRDQMEYLITQLGDMGAGPRDLMDVHVAALDAAVIGQSAERGRALAIDGRLLAIEMMGLLVDYYRVGQRRRFL